MIKFLPFLLIPLLLFGGLMYWRSQASTKQNLATSETAEEEIEETPIEVPKTLPGASLEDRIKSLEETVVKLVSQNNKTASTPAPSGALDSRLDNAEAAVTELKARVSALEKATPAPVSASKSTLYIPMGAGGSYSNLDWVSLNEYEVSLNPDNYPGYTGMVLEVNFRLVDPTGTGYARLYNVTDGSAISSELTTTSSTFGVQTSSSFKLATGTKTYRLQVKSSIGKELVLQSVRIKVNF